LRKGSYRVFSHQFPRRQPSPANLSPVCQLEKEMNPRKSPRVERSKLPVAVKTAPNPRGRRTLYRKEFCDEIVEFCGDGFSITAFAGKIGVARDTISEWASVHREFSAAVRAAKAAAAFSLETQAKRIREKGGAPGSATLVIFGLKNFAPHDFREEQSVQIRGCAGGPIQRIDTRLGITTTDPVEAARVYQLLITGKSGG
jgi:hypothetical protein